MLTSKQMTVEQIDSQINLAPVKQSQHGGEKAENDHQQHDHREEQIGGHPQAAGPDTTGLFTSHHSESPGLRPF